MTFRHRVEEKSKVVERSDHYSAEIDGYRVCLSVEPHLSKLSIMPVHWDPIRIGLLDCCPRNVADIEKFAAVSEGLFMNIAAQLRELGLDDLRCESERYMDDFMKQSRGEK